MNDSTRTDPTRTETALRGCPFCGAKADIYKDNVCTWGLIAHKPDCWLAYSAPSHRQKIPYYEFGLWNRRAE